MSTGGTDGQGSDDDDQLVIDSTDHTIRASPPIGIKPGKLRIQTELSEDRISQASIECFKPILITRDFEKCLFLRLERPQKNNQQIITDDKSTALESSSSIPTPFSHQIIKRIYHRLGLDLHRATVVDAPYPIFRSTGFHRFDHQKPLNGQQILQLIYDADSNSEQNENTNSSSDSLLLFVVQPVVESHHDPDPATDLRASIRSLPTTLSPHQPQQPHRLSLPTPALIDCDRTPPVSRLLPPSAPKHSDKSIKFNRSFEISNPHSVYGIEAEIESCRSSSLSSSVVSLTADRVPLRTSTFIEEFSLPTTNQIQFNPNEEGLDGRLILPSEEEQGEGRVRFSSKKKKGSVDLKRSSGLIKRRRRYPSNLSKSTTNDDQSEIKSTGSFSSVSHHYPSSDDSHQREQQQTINNEYPNESDRDRLLNESERSKLGGFTIRPDLDEIHQNLNWFFPDLVKMKLIFNHYQSNSAYHSHFSNHHSFLNRDDRFMDKHQVFEDLDLIYLRDRSNGNLIRLVKGQPLKTSTYLGEETLSYDHSNGTVIVVKTINHCIYSERISQVFGFLSSLKHPNLVRFLGIEENEEEGKIERIGIEYNSGGNLKQMLIDQNKFSNPKDNGLNLNLIKFYCFEILKGLKFLHEHSIIHTDLRSENIWIDLYGRCKIINFGLINKSFNLQILKTNQINNSIISNSSSSQQKEEEEEETIKNNQLCSIKTLKAKDGDADCNEEGRESLIYNMPPEFFDMKFNNSGNFKLDVWSFGCLVLEIILGFKVWSGFNELQIAYQVGIQRRQPIIMNSIQIDRLTTHFLDQCLTIEVDLRPDLFRLICHRFLEIENLNQLHFDLYHLF